MPKNMRVRVLFFGPLREIAGMAEEEVSLDEETSLGGLFDRYAARHPRMAAMKDSIILARNREFGARSALLAEGDEVAFLPPVSGGVSGGEDDSHVEIVRAPIDTRALVARTQRGEDGAVVTFEGITRNHSGERSTQYLEYEAYEPMALAQMQAIARELKERWKIGRVGIVHRLGRLEIGEASVVIVVTAAHRKPAFEACHYAIDRLKKTVPIWKKEHFTGGAVWVEGEWDETLLTVNQDQSEASIQRGMTIRSLNDILRHRVITLRYPPHPNIDAGSFPAFVSYLTTKSRRVRVASFRFDAGSPVCEVSYIGKARGRGFLDYTFDAPIETISPAMSAETEALEKAKAAWERKYGRIEMSKGRRTAGADKHRSVAHLLLHNRWGPQEWEWMTKLGGRSSDKKSANKFLLACTLDFQMDSKKVWENARKLAEQTLGDPDDLWAVITEGTRDEWNAKWKEYGLHRFPKAHERVWRIGKAICESYGGDARKIWQGQGSTVVLDRFTDLGVGEQISRMVVGALRDTGQIPGKKDDVKADVHLCRVLGRVFQGEALSPPEVRSITRKIHPKDPWQLDSPLWNIGKELCFPAKPNCASCYLTTECVFFEKANE